MLAEAAKKSRIPSSGQLSSIVVCYNVFLFYLTYNYFLWLFQLLDLKDIYDRYSTDLVGKW